MRPIYAVTFELAAGGLEDVIETLSGWIALGTAAPDAIGDLSPGRRTLEVPASDQVVQVEVVKDGDDCLWQAEWQYPHGAEASLREVSRVSAARLAGRLTFAL